MAVANWRCEATSRCCATCRDCCGFGKAAFSPARSTARGVHRRRRAGLQSRPRGEAARQRNARRSLRLPIDLGLARERLGQIRRAVDPCAPVSVRAGDLWRRRRSRDLRRPSVGQHDPARPRRAAARVRLGVGTEGPWWRCCRVRAPTRSDTWARPSSPRRPAARARARAALRAARRGYRAENCAAGDAGEHIRA